jgi:RimK family alpha-L-glutamate ligase
VLNIGILTAMGHDQDRWACVDELVASVEWKGHAAHRLRAAELGFCNLHGEVSVTVAGQPILHTDVIIYRPNFLSDPALHSFCIELLSRSKVPIVNGRADIAASKNKLAQHARGDAAGLPMPQWAIVRSSRDALAVADAIGYPVVAKTPFGSIGTGVFFAQSSEHLSPIVDYLVIAAATPVLIEEFVAEAQRKDVRLFVVNGSVVASMERSARAGDIRANIGQGGTAQSAQPTPEEVDLAQRACALYDLEVAGVDIVRSSRGPLLLEVNANPGVVEVTKHSGVDVAGAIVEHAISRVAP